MGILRPFALLGAGLLAALAITSQANALTVYTTTYTLSGDQEGSSISGASISGSYGSKLYSNGLQNIFSTIQVTSDDQGQSFTYDFSYNCNPLSLGCTSRPAVTSQFPGAGNFFVGYTINDGEIPACARPSLGQTTSCSGTVHTSVSDFVFDSTGRATLTETVSLLAVPEPAEWALFLTGFGSLGLALRRRRRAAAAARV